MDHTVINWMSVSRLEHHLLDARITCLDVNALPIHGHRTAQLDHVFRFDFARNNMVSQNRSQLCCFLGLQQRFDRALGQLCKGFIGRCETVNGRDL